MIMLLHLLAAFLQCSNASADWSTRRDLQSYPWEMELTPLTGSCEVATKTFNMLLFEATELCQATITKITPPAICKASSHADCPPGLDFDCVDSDLLQTTCGVNEHACIRNLRDELTNQLSATIAVLDFAVTGGVGTAAWYAAKAVTVLSTLNFVGDSARMIELGEAMRDFKMGFRRLFKDHPDLLMEIVQHEFDNRAPGTMNAVWEEIDRDTQEYILATACRREADKGLRLLDQETLDRQMNSNPMIPVQGEEYAEIGAVVDEVAESVAGGPLGFIISPAGAALAATDGGGAQIGETVGETLARIDGEWTGNQASCFDLFQNNEQEFANQLWDCAGWGLFGLSMLDSTGIATILYGFVDTDFCADFDDPNEPRYNPRSPLSEDHPWHLIKEDVAARLVTDSDQVLFQSFFSESRGDGESLLHQVKNKLLRSVCDDDSTKFSKGVCRPMNMLIDDADANTDFEWAMRQDTRTQIAFSFQVSRDQCCDKEESNLVDNYAECDAAFLQLELPYSTWGGEINDPERPGGCILDVKTDIVRYNTNFEHSQVIGLDEPLCKKGPNSFLTEFTPIAEIQGYVMGARGQGCPSGMQIVMRQEDCEYALRMFTQNRPDQATVELSYEDSSNYQVGCSLYLGYTGVYNDMHEFSSNAPNFFYSSADSYPVCYEEGTRPDGNENLRVVYDHWTSGCYWFTPYDCPSGYEYYRTLNCGWGMSYRECRKARHICATGTLHQGREVNGIQLHTCIGQTYFGEENTWGSPLTDSAFQVTSGSQYCHVDGDCITDGADRYANLETCTITVMDQGNLQVVEWDIESHYSCNWDSFSVGGQKFCGANSPEGLSVQAGDVISWSSDYSVAGEGWEICLERTGSSSTQSLQIPCDSPLCGGVGKEAEVGATKEIVLETQSSQGYMMQLSDHFRLTVYGLALVGFLALALQAFSLLRSKQDYENIAEQDV